MIRIDKEFKSLIPPLSDEEFKQLEENILRDGIREPLVMWHVPNGDDILIDGHNRWEISVKHAGIPFDIKRMTFDTREDVIQWIILNQFGRRNLSLYDRSLLALKLKPMIEKQAKKRMLSGKKDPNQKSDEGMTSKQLGKIAGVSHDTIHRVEVIEEKATPQTKQLIRDGKLSINQVYNSVHPKQPDSVKQAKQEHEEFIERKQDSVVNMNDIQMDKLNQQIINSALLQEVLELLNKIDAFGMKHRSDELKALHDMIEDDAQRKLIANRCVDCKGILMTIASNII